MSNIHATAIIHDGAQIANSVIIGAYCIIGEHVVLGENVKLHSHVCVDGHTEIGEGTEIFPFASIGLRPQDKKFAGEESRLIIGKNNVIREHVTMNPGTAGGGSLTQIGNNCLFMVASHVAHDCIVGNDVILANNAGIAGHVTVGDGAILGGFCAVHQFVRIGEYAIIGGLSAVEKDVIPYSSAVGERAHLAGLNLIGLKRCNIEKNAINTLRHAYKDLFDTSSGTLLERAKILVQKHDSPEVRAIAEFILSDKDRAICTPAKST